MAGGGVGEAMLIGAAVGATAGGAGAAIQGGDPLQGAMLGGAMGAAGGGLGAGFGGTAAAATPAATSTSVVPGAMAGAEGAALSAAAPAAMPGTVGLGATGTTNMGVGSLFSGAGQGVGTATQLGSSIAGGGSGVAGGIGGIAAPATTAGGASGLGIAQGSALPAGFGGAAPATNIFGQVAGTPGYLSNTALGMTAGTAGIAGLSQAERDQFGMPSSEEYDGPLSKFKYDPDRFTASNPTYAPGSVYRPTYGAEGGIMKAYQAGGPVERMSQMNTAINPQGGLYPQGMIDKTQYAMPTQRPTSMEVIDAGAQRAFAVGGMIDPSMGIAAAQQSRQPSTGSSGIDALVGNKKRMLTKEQMDAVALQGMSKDAMQDVYGQMAAQGLAKGGPTGNKDMAAVDEYVAAAQGGDMASVAAKAQAGDYNAMIALNKVRKTPNQNYAKGGQLGGYSDGGRMLKGPGDGMSDSIPGVIANKQPARLADGEFVVPADVVSHLGNGSTDAGAKQLYAMMNRVRKARTGNPKQGKQIKPAKYMAA
jgi:hypothetical protein